MNIFFFSIFLINGNLLVYTFSRSKSHNEVQNYLKYHNFCLLAYLMHNMYIFIVFPYYKPKITLEISNYIENILNSKKIFICLWIFSFSKNLKFFQRHKSYEFWICLWNRVFQRQKRTPAYTKLLNSLLQKWLKN